MLKTIKQYWLAGLISLPYRAVQGAASPVAGLGKIIDLAWDAVDGLPTDEKETVLGYSRSIFGYTATAVDTAVRAGTSPVAGAGWLFHKIGPAISKALKITPSEFMDGIEEQEHFKFYRYLANTVGTALRLLMSPHFALTKLEYLLGAKVGKALGMDVDVPLEEDGKTIRPEGYWKSVRKGIKESFVLPFRTPLALFVGLSVAYDNILNLITGKEIEGRNYWEHGRRGLLHTGEVALAAPAAVASGAGRAAEIIQNKLAPWGRAMGFEVHDFDWVDKEHDSFRKQYWIYAAFGLWEIFKAPFRVAGLPFAFGSLAADKIKASKNPDQEIDKMTYFEHSARGVLRTLEGAAYAPTLPLAATGKYLKALNRKLASWVGFKVEEERDNSEDSLRARYWHAVGAGIVETFQLPFRILLSPLAGISAIYNGTKPLFKLDDSWWDRHMHAGFWHHATFRGAGLAIAAPFAAAGGVISTIGKNMAKLFGKDLPKDETLWGHKRTWAGYATDALDTVGRTIGSPFAALRYLLTRQMPGAQGANPGDKANFYTKAGLGMAMTLGLPVILPFALVGGIGWALDKATGKEPPKNPDRSVIGMFKDGWQRTLRGAKAVWDHTAGKVLGPAVEKIGKIIKASYEAAAAALSRFAEFIVELIKRATGGSKTENA